MYKKFNMTFLREWRGVVKNGSTKVFRNIPTVELSSHPSLFTTISFLGMWANIPPERQLRRVQMSINELYVQVEMLWRV